LWPIAARWPLDNHADQFLICLLKQSSRASALLTSYARATNLPFASAISGISPARSRRANESGMSRAETRKASQARRISAHSFLPRSRIARVAYLPASAQRIAGSPPRRGNAMLARCKCVLPHAISWSNGRRRRGAALARRN